VTVARNANVTVTANWPAIRNLNVMAMLHVGPAPLLVATTADLMVSGPALVRVDIKWAVFGVG